MHFKHIGYFYKQVVAVYIEKTFAILEKNTKINCKIMSIRMRPQLCL